MIRRLALLLLLTTVPQLGFTEIVVGKGMGEAHFSGRKAKPADQKLALRDAKLNAIDRYIAATGNAKQRSFDLIREQIIANVDDYIPSYTKVEESEERKTKLYNIVIRAEINTTRLDSALFANSAIGTAVDGEKSYLTAIFVAREQTESKAYLDRQYTREDSSTSTSGSMSESQSSDNVDFAEQSSLSTISESGGSISRKADVITYNVSSAESVNSIVTEVFSVGGFDVVEAEYLEEETSGLINVAAFREDFRFGDDISGETRRNAVQGAKMVGVPYIVIGTLDLGLRDTDPASGLVRVFVRVSGKVLDVSSRFPKTIASIGPVQYSGLGPNQTVARTNALQLAARHAAEGLTDQMNAKGVR